MEKISRELEKIILSNLDKGKVIIIIGPRQVGKTTLVKSISNGLQKRSLLLNCDEIETKNLLSTQSLSRLQEIITGYDLVVIDEAQRVKDIGLTLKLIVDNIDVVQLIVTGSSALELSDSIYEPLTGRKFEYHMYPLSLEELKNHFGLFNETKLLHKRLIYGMYPDVVNFPGQEREILNSLASSYLYKDLFAYQELRKPELLDDLLRALAIQVASEVSFHELAKLLSTNSKTIARYIELLEKTYIIFRLRSFSRNIRTELKKSRKIYFIDNGIRNAIIGNFSSLESRVDTGALWENFLISERRKYLMNTGSHARSYFWRTQQQQEIDYIEESDGKIEAYEFKWNKKRKGKFSKTFLRNYDVGNTKIINPDNYWEFVS